MAALVQRAQRGEAAAFAELHASFAAVVHGIALAHAGMRDAEDVTQEVFVRACERLCGLRDAAAFPAWLCRLARHAAIDAARRRRRTAASEFVELPGTERTPQGQAESADTCAQVLACVQTLPVAYREPLILRLCEGLGGNEIAARTGLTHGSVRVNLARGMALLRPLLQARGLP